MSAFLARAPRGLKAIAALAVFLALAADAAAQTETGRITGVVTDATGGILPGVTVTAKAVGTGATRANWPPTPLASTRSLTCRPASTSCPRRSRASIPRTRR